MALTSLNCFVGVCFTLVALWLIFKTLVWFLVSSAVHQSYICSLLKFVPNLPLEDLIMSLYRSSYFKYDEKIFLKTKEGVNGERYFDLTVKKYGKLDMDYLENGVRGVFLMTKLIYELDRIKAKRGKKGNVKAPIEITLTEVLKDKYGEESDGNSLVFKLSLDELDKIRWDSINWESFSILLKDNIVEIEK